MVLGKLPVPGRPTILITVGQGPIVLAVGAGGGSLDIFTLIHPFSSASRPLWEKARYRLKYCLKGPLNPKQPTNQHPLLPSESSCLCPCIFSFCFIPLLLQISPLITEVENIFGDTWLFPAYLSACISHCCIVGDNHGTDVHAVIPPTNEGCQFLAYCCLKKACHV